MEDRTSKQTEDKEPSLGLPPLGYTSNLAFFHLHTKCRILRIYYSEELRKWLLYQKEVTTKWHVDNFLKKSCNAGVKCFFFLFDCHVILIFTSSKKSFLISFVVVFYVRYTWHDIRFAKRGNDTKMILQIVPWLPWFQAWLPTKNAFFSKTCYLQVSREAKQIELTTDLNSLFWRFNGK